MVLLSAALLGVYRKYVALAIAFILWSLVFDQSWNRRSYFRIYRRTSSCISNSCNDESSNCSNDRSSNNRSSCYDKGDSKFDKDYFSTFNFLLAAAAPAKSSSSRSLYQILEVAPNAKSKEIKAAYRKKAKETHPDKNKEKDEEVAAEEFRQVAHAYEVLSDDASRRRYDQTGQSSYSSSSSSSSPNTRGRGGGGDSQSRDFDDGGYDSYSGFFDFSGTNNHRRSNQNNQKQARPFHRLLRDPYLRQQVIGAQSGVINLQSLNHLASVVLDEDTGRLERYVIIAFVDSLSTSVNSDCLYKLNNELLFPWPFAGFGESSNKNKYGSVGSGYWDEILMTLRVEMHHKKAESIIMQRFFGVDKGSSCPVFVFLEHGEALFRDENSGQGQEQGKEKKEEENGGSSSSQSSYESVDNINLYLNQLDARQINVAEQKARFKPSSFASNDDFSSYMWQRLKVSVTFVNNALWPLDFWWLDGNRGNNLGVLEVGERYSTRTFLSHVFVFRPSHVTGNTLTNESSLLWFTAKMEHSGSLIPILPRCFDLSGECNRWKNEGFCEDPKSRGGGAGSISFYVKQNPGFVDWVRRNCAVSCGMPCVAARMESMDVGHRVISKEDWQTPYKKADFKSRATNEF